MLQLTYISTAQPGTADLVLDDILATSRRRNGAAGITGLLLYDGRRFLQALEGEPADVLATYRRVQADPRHRAVVMLSQQEVADRAFGDWAMAARRVAEAKGTSLQMLVDAMTEGLADRTIQATFRSFARVRSAA